MSEQAYRRFMERYQRRMANRQPPKHDAWMNEPVLGRAQEAGLLGLPLPQTEPDLADIVLDLLASADEPPLGGEAQALARAGRGGDSAVGHLTPGEIVVPQRLQTPEVMAALARASHAAGAPLQRMQVGHPANRINPRTGAPEFDDDSEVTLGDQDPSAGDSGDSADYTDLSGAGGGDAASARIAPIAVEGDPQNDITVSAQALPVTPADKANLSALQMGEASGQGRAAQDAVGWSVINRQARSGQPIPDVIRKKTAGKNEYQAVGGPLFNRALNQTLTGPNAAEQARTDASAQAILNGETPDPTGGAEYFYKGTPDQPPSRFFGPGMVSGNLVPTAVIPPFTFLKSFKK